MAEWKRISSLCGLLPGEGMGRGEATGETAGGVFSAERAQRKLVFHGQSHPLAIIEELVTWISEKLQTTPFWPFPPNPQQIEILWID